MSGSHQDQFDAVNRALRPRPAPIDPLAVLAGTALTAAAIVAIVLAGIVLAALTGA